MGLHRANEDIKRKKQKEIFILVKKIYGNKFLFYCVLIEQKRNNLNCIYMRGNFPHPSPYEKNKKKIKSKA